MTILEAIREWMLSNAALSALVGARFEPCRTSQSVEDVSTGGRIEYAQVGRRRIGSTTRRRGTARLKVQFDCIALSPRDAKAISDAAQDILDPVAGVLYRQLTGFMLQHCRVVDDSEEDGHWPAKRGEGVGVYYSRFEADFWYQET